MDIIYYLILKITQHLFIYSMGGVVKSVYDTEQYVRKKKDDRKSKGKSMRSTTNK